MAQKVIFRSPMQGRITVLFLGMGAVVDKRTPLLVMESMKMEHTIAASKDCMVEGSVAQSGIRC
jgi:3-methylcrotonyl-CoA carboxylase alpha subunit